MVVGCADSAPGGMVGQFSVFALSVTAIRIEFVRKNSYFEVEEFSMYGSLFSG